MKKRWRAWLAWLARRLRPFVERHDPMTVPSAPGAVLLPGQHHYRVLRSAPPLYNEWALYDGPNDQEATKWWDHVKSHKERGRMEFWHNGVLRDVYEG